MNERQKLSVLTDINQWMSHNNIQNIKHLLTWTNWNEFFSMACNISFDCNNVQPRSTFCFAVSSCPDSSSGTLRCIIDLRQPIPKRSRCRGHIIISWMFTGVVKQALFAKISSIFIEVLKENWNWQLKNSRISVTQADEAKNTYTTAWSRIHRSTFR